MLNHVVNRFVDRQRWLEPVADFLQKIVAGSYKLLGNPGRALKTFVHGTWLGHPLHPVLTDIPIGAWTIAILLAYAGYIVLLAAAFLGGDLVFRIGTGVNHHAWQEVPTKFTKVLLEGQLTDGALIKAVAGYTPILLYKKGDTVCAIGETCSHAGGPLSEGEMDGNIVQCPWHGSRFDVCSGQVKGGPATISQVRYEVRRQNGQIEVRRSADTLQPN